VKRKRKSAGVVGPGFSNTSRYLTFSSFVASRVPLSLVLPRSSQPIS
jgi:hypothetical protein